MNMLPLFFDIDEFCKFFEPLWRKHLLAKTEEENEFHCLQ